jgi:mRNA-degrading endonuclease RelE of RelBE toxin-antitoxin system
MSNKFEVQFLEEARGFLSKLDEKTFDKIIYNIKKSKEQNDPKLFKKLVGNIWEFRTRYNGLQYRLLAFWDKTGDTDTFVIATHGFVKKVDKIPVTEIEKAENIRDLYFEDKS